MWQFLQNNIFYTPEKIKEINEAQRAQAAANPAAQPPAPRQPISTDRSRYSQGGPRPERVVQPPRERTGRDSRRGTGARDRGAELPTIQTAKVRGRTGAERGVTPEAKPEKTPPTPKAPEGPRNLPADYKQTEQEAGAIAEAYRPGAGFGSEQRINSNGVVQTGSSGKLSGAGFTEANDMLKALGITGVGYGAFESNALQGGRPGVNINYQEPATFDLPAEGAESYSSQKPGAENPLFAPTMETNLTGEADFKVTDPIVTDDSPKMGTSAAYMEQFKRDDLGSMEGLRAAEASKGLLYASGQYWKANPNAGQEGESDFLKISKDEYNAIKNSDQHAQQFAADKVKQTVEFMKDPGEEPIASSYVESPVDMNESPAEFEAPLTDMPSYTEKDHTGRFNIFR